ERGGRGTAGGDDAAGAAADPERLHRPHLLARAAGAGDAADRLRRRPVACSARGHPGAPLPGERAEVLVALQPGQEVRLHSYEPDLGQVAAPFAVGANDAFDVLALVAAEELTASAEVPEQLASFGLDAGAVSVRRHFELQGRQINAARMDMARIDEAVQVGSTELWTVRNLDLFPHNFHVHDVQFEVHAIDGAPPPPELAGRKDTVYTEPHRDYELLLTFTDYTDTQWPYMYH